MLSNSNANINGVDKVIASDDVVDGAVSSKHDADSNLESPAIFTLIDIFDQAEQIAAPEKRDTLIDSVSGVPTIGVDEIDALDSAELITSVNAENLLSNVVHDAPDDVVRRINGNPTSDESNSISNTLKDDYFRQNEKFIDKTALADASFVLKSIPPGDGNAHEGRERENSASINGEDALVNSKSTTKELLQYLFTGNPDGADEINKEKYLGDALPVISTNTKVKGATTNGKREYERFNGRTSGSAELVDSLVAGISENEDDLVEGTTNPSIEKVHADDASTNELLDILFGTREKESNGEDRRNDKKDNPHSVSYGNERSKEGKDMERSTSSTIRKMALFTLKELLAQDRQ